MNGKRAKRLRRKAAELTVGKPALDYEVLKVSNARTGALQYTVCLKDCTRATYQHLKRASA